MKAQELRIGNLVFIENDLLPETKGKIYKVYGVSEKYNFDFPESTGTVSLNQIGTIRNYSQFDEFIKPIPLTKEWLLKFRFKKSVEDFYSIKTGRKNVTLEICLSEQRTILFNKRLNEYIELKNIEYVHQLQNLYFVLTGEEITI